MIIYKQWMKRSRGGLNRLYCEGWYLFGLIPLYIRYVDYDLPLPAGKE